MGKININIQREERLHAINNLSKAIYEVAKSLNTPINISISECNFETNGGTGVDIQSLDKVDKETVIVVEE